MISRTPATCEPRGCPSRRDRRAEASARGHSADRPELLRHPSLPRGARERRSEAQARRECRRLPVMELSNRGGDVKYLCAWRCVGRVHGCLRGQHRSPHDGACGTSLQCGRRTLLSQGCNPISGMARLTSRQGPLGRSDSQRYPDLRCGSFKELAGFKHRMHYHRQFARHSHGSSFEADPLPELETPCPQGALG